MSYDPRGAGVPHGASAYRSRDARPARKGSVKAARQRVQEEHTRVDEDDYSTPYYGSYAAPPTHSGRANELVSQFNPHNRPQPQIQLPTPPSSRGSSRHQQRAPDQQWPLPEGHEDGPRQRTNERSAPPQRPPRPSYVPSILDPTVQQTMLRAPQRPGVPPMPAPSQSRPPHSPPDDGFLSPNTYVPSPQTNRPNTTSSLSSIGTIPDFPVPSMTAVPAPRKSPNIGPPPSARRGPSSYYSQASYVSPIVEEAESNRSHNSFASSNVIPTYSEEFYSDEDEERLASDDEDVLNLSRTTTDNDGRSSRNTDEGDSANLVRKASFGRRAQPSLTTIRSVENLKPNSRKNSFVGQAAMAAGAAGGAFAAGLGASNNAREEQRSSSRPDSEALASGTGLFGPSSSSSSNSSQDSLPLYGKNTKSKGPSPLGQSPSLPPAQPEADRVLNGLQKGGMFASAKPVQQGSLAGRVGGKRPPRLNMDSVRDAEARGSLTSLPDLIKRATKLAGNLDRGKTASRLGLDFWEKGGQDEKSNPQHNRKSGSLSDILSSFPPPAIGTPVGGGTPHDRPVSQWPSGLAMEKHYDDGPYDQRRSNGRKKQGRRCCGMPLWCFITLITLLAVLAIAAVVVPVCLIVIPGNHSSGSSSSKALAACQTSLPCQNGGTSQVNPSGSCSCLCSNGYTGDTCSTESDSSCTTATIGSTANATIGSSIPALFDIGSSNFSIPLDASTLLALFSSSNLTCTSENALVTFNGLSSRSVDLLDDAEEPARIPAPTGTATIAPRAAKTSDGIIFDGTSATSTASSTPTASASSDSSSSKSSASTDSATKKQLSFARVGVLFVLQETSALDAAVTAQESFQTWLSDSADERNGTEVDLGNGFTADMDLWQILLANGTSVGAIE